MDDAPNISLVDIDHIPQLVWAADPHGNLLFVNSECRRFFGRDDAPDGWASFMHEDDWPVVIETWRNSLASGAPFEVEARFRRADGTYRWLMNRAIAIINAEGRIERWLGASSDVHERRELVERLRISEAQARTLGDAIPQLVWISGVDGRLEWFNRHWTEYTGLDLEQSLARQGTDWGGTIHPDDAQMVVARWYLAFNAGSTYEVESRLRRHDGVYRWFLARGVPLRDPAGHIVRWFGTCTDIDERKRSEQRLRLISEIGDVFAGAKLATALQTVAESAVPAVADWCNIYLSLPNGTLEPAAIAHSDPAQVAFARTMSSEYLRPSARTAEVMQTGKPLHLERLPDAWLDEIALDAGHREFLHRLDIRSVAAFPLTLRGRSIGLLYLAGTSNRPSFSRDDVEFGITFAARVSTAIEGKVTRKRMRLAAEAGQVMAESLELQRRLDRLLAILVPQLATWAVIYLVEGDRLKTVAVAHADPEKRAILERLRGTYPMRRESDAAALKRLEDESTRISREVALDEIGRVARPETMRVLDELGVASTVRVPLQANDRTIGALVVYRSHGEKPYSALDVPLIEELGRRAALAVESALLYERERRVAETFQQAALPHRLPVVPGIAFDGFYHPARDDALVGGDWYDALKLSDGRIVISVGDVSGSGLDAAVIMSAMRQVIRGVAQVHADPCAILDAADRTLKAEHPDRIVTAVVGVLDPIARTLTYASAGHPPPLLRYENGAIRELAARELPLGLRVKSDPASTVVDLPEHAMLVFYSDGLTESTRDVLEGERRLHAVVGGDEILQWPRTARAVFDAMTDQGAHDDVVVLTLRIDLSRGARSYEETVRRWGFDSGDAASANAVRRDVGTTLRERDTHEREIVTVELILSELIGNVVRYAPGPVEVILDLSEQAAVLHVLDSGSGFTLAPRLPSDLLSERGRGLYLVWSLAEDFNVTKRPEGGAHARVVLPAHAWSPEQADSQPVHRIPDPISSFR